MMIAYATTPLLGMADAAVIGHLGEAALVGGIATAAIVFDFVFWSLGFLRMGTAGLTAQAVGAGDVAEQRATLVRSLVLSSGLGLGLILLQGLIGYVAFRLIDASPAVTQAARAYFEIRIWSAPITLSGYATFGAIVGRGRTDLGLVIQVAVNLLNIALNVLFVIGLGMGVRGSALGTLLAESAGLVLNLSIVRGLSGPLLAIDWARVFDRERFRRMLAMNFDIMLRTSLLICVSGFFLRRGAHVDDATLAANSALMTFAMALASLVDGFGTAGEQLCGQSVGARDADAFRRAAKLCCLWAIASGAAIGLSAWLVGGFYVDAVAPTPQVREIARTFLPCAAAIPFLGALAFAFDGVFIGAGWARDMRNTMLAAAVFYLAAAFGLASFGNGGLWGAQMMFYVARGLGQLWLYPRRTAETFPEAQSAALTPTASASCA